jgi:hypothetical protein
MNLNTNSEQSLLSLANVEALADEITSGAGLDQSNCASNGGYWNMALVCDGGGVNSVQCQIDGSISLFGISVSGSYKQGTTYNVGWERWACVISPGNCCIASSQGIKVLG